MANSFVRYTGNNSTTSYSIPFSYRATGDLTVTLSGVVTTAYTLNSAGTTLTFNTAPAQDVAIEIRRRTSQGTKLVDYASGSVLTENDLDTDSDQAFFMSQEAIDDAGDVIKVSNTNFQWDVQNKRLTNVADPVDNTDAVNKQFISNNIPNITTVAGIASDVTTVANNDANITAVANDATDIGTVATNIASVNTVATNINDVIKVADDLNEAISEVETVANDLNEATSEIEVVANNIANVNTVGTINADVTTVANNETDIQTLADLENGTVTTNGLSTLAGLNTEIQGVYNIRTNVTNVDTNATNVNLVAGQISPTNNISAVGAVATQIGTLGALGTEITNLNNIRTDITGVNNIAGDVTAVKNNATNITAVKNNETNINAVNANSVNINAVKTNEANINAVNANSANINTVAGLDTEITALGASGTVASINTVANNLASVNNFANTYLGASATAPTQDPDGSALDLGDLYFDTASDTMKVYSSGGWINAGSAVNGTANRFKYTATASQTTFTGADDNSNTLAYDAGFIDVYLNGIRLVNGSDFTATSGTSIVLTTGASVNDILEIVAFGTFTLSNFSITNANDVPALGSAGQVLQVNSGATALEFGTVDLANLNADNLTSGTVPSARVSGAYTGITQTGTLANSGATITSFNRTTSDGNLLDFKRNNISVGGINAEGGDLAIGTGITGLQFYDNAQAIRPFNISTNTHSDNTFDLGRSVNRFKDLYLGGGLYVGGTGTANKLDDYEEGTFTPDISTAGGTLSVTYAERAGKYTKIGNVVYYEYYIETSGFSGGTGSITFSGFPFTAQSGRGAIGLAAGSRIDFGLESAAIVPTASSSNFRVFIKNSTGTGTSDNQTLLDASDWSNANPTVMYGSGYYRTDS